MKVYCGVIAGRRTPCDESKCIFMLEWKRFFRYQSVSTVSMQGISGGGCELSLDPKVAILFGRE
jgi:hypothetical protein